MYKISKNKTVLILFIIIFLAGCFGIFSLRREGAIKSEAGLKNIVRENVSLLVDFGDEASSTTAQIDYVQGMTAFDVLNAANLGLKIKTKNYDMGVFIESIGEKANGQDGKYWLYYVNGETPSLSADKKEVMAGDKVEFKFEKSPF